MNLTAARRSKRVLVYSLGTLALLIAALIPTVATAVVPNPPVDLVAVRGAQSPVIASLSWTAPADTQVDYYRVLARAGASGPFTSEKLVQETSFDFIDGLGGIEYHFLVTAIDTSGRESAAAIAGPVSAAWADSPHERSGADGSRCLTCHSVHNAGSDRLLRQELTGDERGSQCTTCHDGRVARAANVSSGTVQFRLPSGHGLGAAARGTVSIDDCSTCHDTHGARQDARMIPAKQVNGVAVTSAGNQLCLACHDTKNSWTGSDYPSTAEPTRDATGYPVSGRWPGPDTYGSASNPHRLIPESTQTVVAGDPVSRERGDCRYCHTAHAAPNDYDGLRATYTVPTASTLASDQADGSSAALCYTCHGGTAPNGFTAAPGTDIKRFSTADATSSAGHTIVTAGGTLPVGAPMPCFECHNPHGSKRGNASQLSDELGAGLATDDAGGVRAFCFTCHTTSDTTAGWDSDAAAYGAVDPAETVVGLPRSGALLRLPAGAAHEQGDGRSCYDCHGDDYGPGGRNVHNPAKGPAQLEAPVGSQPDTVTAGSPDTSMTTEAGDASTDATPSVGGSDTVAPVEPVHEESSSPLLMQISEAIAGFFSALA